MQHATLLNNLDSKNARVSKRNVSNTNSRTTVDGFSYREVLSSELSKSSSQLRQSNSNKNIKVATRTDNNDVDTLPCNKVLRWSEINGQDFVVPFSGPGGSYVDMLKNMENPTTEIIENQPEESPVNPVEAIKIDSPTNEISSVPLTDKLLKYDFNNDGVVDEQDNAILQDKIMVIKKADIYSDEELSQDFRFLPNVVLTCESLEENETAYCVKLKLANDLESKIYWIKKSTLETYSIDKSQFTNAIIENDLMGESVNLIDSQFAVWTNSSRFFVNSDGILWYLKGRVEIPKDGNKIFFQGDGSSVTFSSDITQNMFIRNKYARLVARVYGGDNVTISYDMLPNSYMDCLFVNELSKNLDIDLLGSTTALIVENIGGNTIRIPSNYKSTVKGSKGDDTFNIIYGIDSNAKITGNGGHNTFNITNAGDDSFPTVTECAVIEDFNGTSDTLNFEKFDGLLSVNYNSDGSMTINFGDNAVVKIQGKNLEEVQRVVNAHNEKINPTSSYLEWGAIANRDVDIYKDSSLTTKEYGKEKIYSGEPVIIINATDTAYEVKYGIGTSPNYTGYETGWVSQDILLPIEQPIAVQEQSPSSEEKIIEQKTTPTITEDVTESERTFYVTPGYKKEGYNTVGGGLYIYDLNVNDDPNAEFPITFNLYNTVNATGFIEYYDENGKFIKAERINPHDHVITSPVKWFEEVCKLYDNIKQYGFGESPITDPYNSTNKPIEAPKGTRTIVVTTNQKASAYAKISEFVDNWFKALDITKKVASIAKSIKAEDTLNQILVVPTKEKITTIIMNRISDITRQDVGKFGETLLDSVLKRLSKEEFQNLTNQIVQDIDIKKIMSDILEDLEKNGQKIALELVGTSITQAVYTILGNSNPTTIGLKAMELFGKLLDDFSNDIIEKKLENVKPMIFKLT